ncbi:MAG: 1-acyl-sn-glycerol-3-phosphate acyltransferase [Gammaproteobacteria bacterium]|nr:1-acyl-sn-glycerol-3-phosphate acyltransferase [Gammaproteobacteria bacterium]MDH5651742.1 1-acyl-sn-glycerol-3-phosphate acyltransferase [Gammaproteobacteria bacterium]
MLLKFLLRVLWLTYCWLELGIFSLFLYTLSYFPDRLLKPWYFVAFRYWCRSFVSALGVELQLHQKNRFPIPEQFILISNHPSAFEDVGIPTLFNVYSLAKAEVADWYICGRIVKAAGNLFVKRESKESRRNARDQLVNALQSGKSIAIYPEGGCKGRRLFSSFRYGAFDISMETGVPILPVFLHYESQADFEWRDPQTLVHKFWHMMTAQNNRVNYYCYDALNPADFADKEAYNAHAYNLFLTWQAKYLE